MIRLNRSYGLLLVIGICFSLLGCSTQAKPFAKHPKLKAPDYPGLALAQKGTDKYSYKGEWPQVPKELVVYRWNQDKGQFQGARLARHILDKPERVRDAGFPGQIWRGEKGDRVFLDGEGSSLYIPTQKSGKTKESGQINAELASKEYLKRIGLWPGGNLILQKTNHQKVKEIDYLRLLNGYADLASRIKVIMNGKRVSLVQFKWPYLETVGKYPIISPAKAFSKLNEAKSLFPRSPKGTIDSVKLAYYTLFDQPYLMPVYVFEYQAGSKTVVNMVWAVEDKYLK